MQAQTVANAYLAVSNNLAIVPVLNKIDMQASRPEEIKEEIMTTPGDRPRRGPGHQRQDRAGRARRLPRDHRARSRPRRAIPTAPLRALIFDSKFDDYQGVITYVRVVDGTLRVGQKIRLMAGETEHEVTGLGRFRPREVACDELGVGPGRLRHRQHQAALRHPDRRHDHPDAAAGRRWPCPATRSPCRSSSAASSRPRNNQFDDLRTALQKLALNDSSFTFEPETSDALGFGFRCGFLGMLHMEIVQQRLERESNLSLVQTAPNVTYEILTRKGETLHISNPTRIPDAGEIEEFREPIVPRQLHPPRRLASAPSCSSARIGAAFTSRPSTSRRPGPS